MSDDLAKQGPRIQSDRIDYVALWQYFEKRGSELKGTMLQVLTWLIGFAAAILGYAVDKTIGFDPAPSVKQPLLLLVLAAVGIAIIVYAEIVIREFGEHINRNFDRAAYSRIGNKPLDEILNFSENNGRPTQAPPRLCITVRRITRTFGAAFAVTFAFGLIWLWWSK
ncbi:MAG: hypothetical protein ACYTG0_05890 [Planctomycetota bacterium]|jgi:hypothetical protein